MLKDMAFYAVFVTLVYAIVWAAGGTALMNPFALGCICGFIAYRMVLKRNARRGRG